MTITYLPTAKFRLKYIPIGQLAIERMMHGSSYLDQNFILWSKNEAWDETIAPCEVMLTIFHKDIIDLRQRTEPEIKVDEVIPGDHPKDKDLIEVVNPTTGEVERIRRDDPQYYSADGFKIRRYKGSSKPMDIPSFVW